jgi:putative endonuclease
MAKKPSALLTICCVEPSRASEPEGRARRGIKMWYVYILECRNKALYTGVTNNIERRLKDHQTGQGGHYTSCNRPRRILYTEEFKDKSEAKNREQQIKRWSKSKKLVLIKGDRAELINLSKSRD